MSGRMLFANVVSFALQVTVIVGAGAALARVLRLDEPRAMLAFWRTLLAACLLLPLCQPWNIVVPPALSNPTEALIAARTVEISATTAAPAAARSVSWPIVEIALIALAAGVGARVLWLMIGAYALRRLRRDALPLEPLPESIRAAQERIGARAGMYISDRVPGPITFGLRRPIVLFPPGVSAMPSHVQEAIACHELLHVRRRDWIYEIVEEAVRSVLWFHPAIWWLIGRIQLTREQVVDQAVIRLTDSREGYVESLLAVALAGSRSAFTPASPFLRRHLLKKRVARILQETTMSTRRLIASLSVSAAVLSLAATLAVRSFPLEAQGLAQADNGQPIQLVRGGEHLLHGSLPEYPHRAIEQKVEGDVVVEITLDDRGEVSDARVVSGPDELRKAALEAVLHWHYSPSEMRSTVTQATLRFRVPVQPDKDALTPMDYEKVVVAYEKMKLAAYAIELKGGVEVEVDAHPPAKGVPGGVPGGVPDGVPGGVDEVPIKLKLLGHPKLNFDGTERLVDVTTDHVSESIVKAVLAQAGVTLGDAVTEDVVKRLEQAAQAIDEHFGLAFRKADSGGLVLTILAR